MDKFITITLVLIVLMATVTTVEALSVDTKKNIEIILKRDGTNVKIKCSSEKNFNEQLESYRMYLAGDTKEKIKI